MTEKTDIQEILNMTTNAGLLNPPTVLLGHKLRPITLASIALLQQLKSPLISGTVIDQVENIILDCCIFIKVQSSSVKEATKLVFGPKEALYESALELADSIAPNEIETVVSSIIALLRDSTSTRVTVEPDAPTDVMRATKEKAEPQGND